MNIETFRDYCISKPGVSEEFPFDSETLVFKVGGKMFALTNIDLFDNITLKSDPMLALELRERHHAVGPGFHMNKKHWNTVICDGTIPDDEIIEMIDNSYDLVVKGLKKSDKEQLKQLGNV